jgi:hypothetical protein
MTTPRCPENYQMFAPDAPEEVRKLVVATTLGPHQWVRFGASRWDGVDVVWYECVYCLEDKCVEKGRL